MRLVARSAKTQLWHEARSLPAKGEVAGSKSIWVTVDPELPLKIGPLNEREAQESGLWLKA